METKSRYEVIAELEAKKREYIQSGDLLDEEIKIKEKEIKNINRHLEDKEEELKAFKEGLVGKKEMLKSLIESVDDSLKRFEGMSSQSQKK